MTAVDEIVSSVYTTANVNGKPEVPVDAPVLVGSENEIADIDPATWLTGSLDEPEASYGYYILPGGKGRIKLAGLTDAEENQIRVNSGRINPKSPAGPRILDMMKYRRNMVAASMNKAKTGSLIGDVQGDQLSTRMSGALAKMFEAVTQASQFQAAENLSDEAATVFLPGP